MPLKVDKEKCIGCGFCAHICPEVFELKNGKAEVKKGADLKKNKNCIDKAIKSCPVKAISK